MTITLASTPKLLTTYGWSSRLGDSLRLGTLSIARPKAYIMETDTVLCECCYESRNEDRDHNHMDNDPSYWLSSTRAWHPLDQCDYCATKTGDGTDLDEEPIIRVASPQVFL